MVNFGAFQAGREQYLKSSRNKSEEVLDLEQLEKENGQLEEKNQELRFQIEEKEVRILKSPAGRKIFSSYLLTTPLGVLYEAIKTMGTDEQEKKSLLETVAKIERSRLESDYDIEIVEPGEITSEIVSSVSAVLKHELYISNSEAKMIVAEAIQRLGQLGEMSPSDTRMVAQVFKVIPSEHLSASVKTIEKTPVRETLSILQDLSKKLEKITDKEMADRVTTLHQELNEEHGGTAAYIRPSEKQVVFARKVSSLFAWTLAHEVGHGVYRNILKSEQVGDWEKISKRALTQYGKHVDDENQASENFSESYALFLLNKPLFKMLAVFDEDFEKQYEFFKTIMPKGTSNFPKAAGIFHPLIDNGSSWLFGALEKITKIPFYETAKQSLKYTYNKKKKAEVYAPLDASLSERMEKIAQKVRDVLIGKVNPELIQYQKDTVAFNRFMKEFMKNDVTELHQSRKIVRLLIENDLMDEAYDQAEKMSINNLSLRQLASSSSLMSAYAVVDLGKADDEFIENARLAAAIFLEDGIKIISNLGERTFWYKNEFQEKIDNLLSEQDVDQVVPLSYEVKMDGLRAVNQPVESDFREVQRMKEKYGVEFKNSEERGFSAIALKRLEDAIIELPLEDLRLSAGFIRFSENISVKTLRSLLEANGKLLIPVDDQFLVWSKTDLQSFITQQIAQAVLRNNNDLALEFRKISGWQEVKPPLHTRVLAKFFSRNNPNFNFRFNPLGPENFINQSSRLTLETDFQICYQWFLLYRDEFKELARTNPTLQAKYEVLEKHVSKKK